MEVIKFVNGKECQAKDFILSQGDTCFGFTACGVPDYPSLRNDLTPANLSTIHIITEGGAVSAIYEGYTQLGSRYSVEKNEDGTMDITVYLLRENATQKCMDQLRADLDYLAMMGGIEL